MTRTYVVSGAASGIGAATVRHLRDEGHRVLTLDRTPTDHTGGPIDVVADLATRPGRAEAVAGVQALAEVVHGVVPAAGVGGGAGPYGAKAASSVRRGRRACRGVALGGSML